MDLGNWYAPAIGSGVSELGSTSSSNQNSSQPDEDYSNYMDSMFNQPNYENVATTGFLDNYNGPTPFNMQDLYSPGNEWSSDLTNQYMGSMNSGPQDMATGYSNGDGTGGNEFLKKYRDTVSPLQGLLKNPIVSTLMSLNPATAVLKAVLGGPQSAGGFLGSLFGSTPLGKLAGGLAGSQLAGYATNGQFTPMSNGQIGGLAGSTLGALSGLPFGSMAGGYAGSQLGNSFMPGESGGMPTGNSGGMEGMFGGTSGGYSPMPQGIGQSTGGQPNMLQTGMNNSLLGSIAGAGMAMNNNRVLGNQISTLEGLFGQNSSYAQAMRQQLERRDAAAGRRSQYGPREVELQAALAGNAAKLQPGLQQLYGQKMGNTNLAIQSLLRNPNLGSGLSQAGSWLSGLFNQPSSTVTNNPYWNDGGFQSGNEGMGD